MHSTTDKVMIRSRKQVESFKILETSKDACTAIDLQQEAEKADAEGSKDIGTSEYEFYILRLHDGDITESDAEMLFFPNAGRIGIAWGGDADWFDADRPEDAAQLWVSGEWEHYE